MSKDKKTICWLSDSTTLPTGYATMTLNILNGLSKDYDCHQLAHNFTGQTLVPPIKFEDGSSINFKLHGNGMRPYYEDLIGVKLKELDADVFVTLLDTFMVTPFFPNYNFGKAKTIFYFPSDGGSGIPLGCENVLKKMDIPIAMAKFGQKQVEDMYGIKCRYIPHGVDSKMFHPLSKEEKLKLRQKFHLVDKFVIGVVARNQGRKMLDRTLKAFKLFIDKAPNAVLLLHCDPNDPAAIFPMQKMIERYKLQNRVLFTTYTGNLTNLSEMEDVNIPAPGDGEVLTWDNAAGTWISQSISALSKWIVNTTNGYLYNTTNTISFNDTHIILIVDGLEKGFNKQKILRFEVVQ